MMIQSFVEVATFVESDIENDGFLIYDSIMTIKEPGTYYNDFGRTFGKPVGDLLLDGDILKKCKSSATEVVIPDNIREIDSFAFYDCIKLTSVIIPNSVKKIGDCAFANCSSLTNVTIPKTVKNTDNNYERFY